jgi:serine protease Do
MKNKLLITAVIVLTLTSGILLGRFALPKNNSNTNSGNVRLISNENVANNQNISDTRQTAITRAVEKVSKAIVGINVVEVREVQDPYSQFFGDDPFFKQFFGNRGAMKQEVRGLGSGYIISPDGYVLTNDHVAGNATKITVTLTDGSTVSAKLIGSDPVSDVALLKIDRSNLNYVNLGNSDNAIIGEWVVALGNPFGLFEINDKPTVTVGVISATNMKVTAEGNRAYKDMIQTDASINAGNSGGPLVNADGDVIGMNTIIYTGGQYNTGSIGVGFAISINRVKQITEELRSKGKIERNPNVGFRVQGIDERLSNYYNLKSTDGVIVTQILKGGIADNAGLRTEDIIVEANGERIKSDQDLILIVNDLRAGENLRLKILRSGSEKEINMKL